MPIPLNLAVEDELSEAALRRLLAASERGYAVGHVYGRTGNGYLKNSIDGWNAGAQYTPFAVATDLDDSACPPRLIEAWFATPMHHNLLFFVAVREIESWLLADRQNLSDYFGIQERHFPHNPDALPDPKATLVEIARRARRSVRDCVVPRSGSTAKQGPDYNACLSEFVFKRWSIPTAARESPSLDRAVRKVRTFEPQWP
jgi:hypothetical protein